MNIFYLDSNPKLCAKYHNNKHCIKQILEVAQLLSSACWVNGIEAPYKPTHINHPCTKWVRENRRHYMWLCELGIELCWEYTMRYGKTHKTQDVIIWLTDNRPDLPNIRFTPPPLAMPDEYKELCHVQSYRNYYMGEKRNFCNWKYRDVPSWFK